MTQRRLKMANYGTEIVEDLNVPKCDLTYFKKKLKGRLALLTGIRTLPANSHITLADIRKPFCVIGDPGTGKTEGIASVVHELNAILSDDKKLNFKEIKLSTYSVGELSGIPIVKSANGKIDGSTSKKLEDEVIRLMVPDLPVAERDGEYGVLFIDEITTAELYQVQPALGLTDGTRKINTYKLPEHWMVVAAGNGPNCTNFVAFPSMLISRFRVFDIEYKLEDFLDYAHDPERGNISADILAYLNLKPDAVVHMEGSDMDKAGKAYPCPRSWTALSKALQIEELDSDEPLSIADIRQTAGQYIGGIEGDKFATFCQLKTDMNYSPKKIIEGKEAKPTHAIKKEVLLLTFQHTLKLLQTDVLPNLVIEETPLGLNFAGDDAIMKIANFTSWFLSFINYDFDTVMSVIVNMVHVEPRLTQLYSDLDFMELCPELKDVLNNPQISDYMCSIGSLC